MKRKKKCFSSRNSNNYSETFLFIYFLKQKKKNHNNNNGFECVLTCNRRKAVREAFEGIIPGITAESFGNTHANFNDEVGERQFQRGPRTKNIHKIYLNGNRNNQKRVHGLAWLRLINKNRNIKTWHKHWNKNKTDLRNRKIREAHCRGMRKSEEERKAPQTKRSRWRLRSDLTRSRDSRPLCLL